MSVTSHPAFEWLRSQVIPSLNVTVHEFRHRVTGAQHIHIEADNNENVFLVAFRTVPHDSTGVAHILEHTVLCGSEKYPVRDPFFLMTRRSLNTFMNAFTSSDWTAYPFASQNRKDFENLLAVYLDAVFFSRLDPLDFAQEGHRLEFEQPDDPTTPLMYKGVVFNEMKGAMSSPTSTLWHTLCKYVFPTNTYHHNSGGDPDCIPDLTYEQLLDFYRTHYHPSNAIFMTFGDIPAAEHQARFETLALNRFQPLDNNIQVADEKRYLAPVRVEEAYAYDEDDTRNKTHIVMAWLLGQSADLESHLQAQLLTAVLLDNAASPLMQALETSHLGKSPSPLCGLEDSQKELLFMAGLEGSEISHTEQVEYMILDVLESIAEKGVPHDKIEACLHQLELQQREITGGGYPYGLQLILQALNSATHRGDPVALLDLEPALARLRQQASRSDFIPSLVRQLLLENRHRVTLTLRPDKDLNTRRDAAEKAKLAIILSQLDEPQRQQIVEQGKSLLERQQAPVDDDVLPRVTLQDVPAAIEIPQPESVQTTPIPLTRYRAGTNGLVYLELLVPLPSLTQTELALLPLYTAFLTDVGVSGNDYLHTQHRQASVCGSIRAQTMMRGDIDDSHAVRGFLTLSTKALARNQSQAGELLRDTWCDPRFDEQQRLRELMEQVRVRLERNLTQNGHGLAMSAASACLSPLARYHHEVTGLAGIAPIKHLEQSLRDETGLAMFSSQLAQLHRKLLQQPVQFLLVGEQERLDACTSSLLGHWQHVQPGEATQFKLEHQPGSMRHYWPTSTQVNFCACAWPTVAMNHPDAAALTVLGSYLRNEFLHRAIREQGGAYGGGASQDSTQGVFRMYSYRDPRLGDTLADFQQSLNWLADHTPRSRKVEEAILGIVASIDKPGSPAGEAKGAFHNHLFGRDDAVRQRFRERILAVTGPDLQAAGARYLRPELAQTAVLGSQQATTEATRLGLEICKLA